MDDEMQVQEPVEDAPVEAPAEEPVEAPAEPAVEGSAPEAEA